MRRRTALLALLALSAAAPAADFQPDPRSVRRYGPAYCYPQGGWIVLHIEGEPYERGVQHGRLLAAEIAANLRCYAAVLSPKGPAEGWRHVRTLANAVFLRRYDKEYIEEMKGIADGANADGARFDGRPLDVVDLAALNAWPEIDTLPSALEALPTGLEGRQFGPETKPAPKPMRCSAFAATGPATRDGKVVFGHITMFGLYPANFYNVWLDVKPARGHRVLMQSYPGGMQSGMDYYLNDAGLVVCETTIGQTRFEGTGQALASRIRKALQYADSIDRAVAILKENNNGLYTNEWLLADVKTDEIAMFELGTHKSRLWRSSKGEWFGGTEGFYWGCNNTKDLEVRLETLPGVEGRPASVVFRSSDRDRAWLKFYDAHKGSIDAEAGKLAFRTAPLAAAHSLDAKITTSALARDLKSWALFGPPLGPTWRPTFEERQRFPEVRPLVPGPWALLGGDAPQGKAAGPAPLDLADPAKAYTSCKPPHDEADPPTVPAWHGTVLPASDADVWLATGFAHYERVVALEKALQTKSDGKLTQADRDRLALALFQYRAEYSFAARAGTEVPLARTKADLRSDEWARVASGKGVLLLDALRREVGAERFDALMDGFGRANAGKAVTAAAFRAHAEKANESDLGAFFDRWLNQTGLPGGQERPGGPFAVQAFLAELDKTLIVCGTEDEAAANREAARAVQEGVRRRHSNVVLPIRTDAELTAEEAASHHLILIGRPDTNRWARRFRDALPVTFGRGSFEVGKEVYAHPGSGVACAADNGRFSVVVIAGLSPAATLRAAEQAARATRPAEVIVYAHGVGPRSLLTLARPAVRPGGE
jgi:hypothetical protein